jgi:hypothetical protein
MYAIWSLILRLSYVSVLLFANPPTLLSVLRVLLVVLMLFRDMYHFLTASVEERQAERERQRRFIGNLPHKSAAATYLARRASCLLDVQIRLEDAAILLETVTAVAGHAPECQSAAKQLRTALPALTGEVNNIVLAAKYDIDAAAEACDADKVFSGGQAAFPPA